MKKNYLLFAILILFVSTSCHKDPDMGELDDDYVVVTDHDLDANFSTYTTYYIPDSLMVIGNSATPTWMVSQPGDVISTIVSNMNTRGFVRTTNKEIADLGIQATYVENTTYIAYDPTYPYWWWGYPGYWNPTYWGDWTGWYYPYSFVYSYNVGSLLTEIVDLKSSTGGTDPKLNVLWTAYMAGLMSGSTSIDTQLAVNAVNQAFVQSPYIKK